MPTRAVFLFDIIFEIHPLFAEALLCFRGIDKKSSVYQTLPSFFQGSKGMNLFKQIAGDFDLVIF